jgi:hypothetical protein
MKKLLGIIVLGLLLSGNAYADGHRWENSDLKISDYYAMDNELGDYITLMADVVIGDVDPQIEFDVESDDHHRYVIVNILDKVLH